MTKINPFLPFQGQKAETTALPTDFKPTAKAEERINALGLDILVKDKENLSDFQFLSELDNLVGKSAKDLSKIRWKFKYNNSDVAKSIKHLELFCLYCFQFIVSAGASTIESIYEHGTCREQYYDKIVFKTIAELEQLAAQLTSTHTRESKQVLEALINSVMQHINKLLFKDLSRSGRESNIAMIKKAEKILKKFASS